MKRLISNLLARMLLILPLLAPGGMAQASSTIDFCNVGNTTLFVVMIGQTPGGMLAMDGWQQVDIGHCRSDTVSYLSAVGFAVVLDDGRKAMQVYDAALFDEFAVNATEWRYCVDPYKNFHREERLFKIFARCRPGDVPARFAFNVKPKVGETLTLRIPTDKDGAVFPLIDPRALQPFELNAWVPTPNASFLTAMRGLAEQQERLGFRIQQNDVSPTPSWPARYIRELGLVVQPETHAVSVVRDSPADKAGIRHGDEILRIDDIELKSAWHARGLLARTRPGETHTIVFLHGGQIHSEDIKLEALPASLAASDLHPEQGWLGVEFESAARVAGVIYREGTAHLALDDDIQKINRTEFDGVEGLSEWLVRNLDGATVELQVWRRSEGKILVMTLDKLE